MARVARIVVPDVPFHLTQRGNFGSAVFRTDSDRKSYLRIFRYYSRKHRLDIWAYCLMENHVHFVAVPRQKESMARTIHGTHTKYSRHFLEGLGLQGHLWQGRYFSCPLGDAHLWNAVRYVEQNPVRAGLVSVAEEYPWSSARAHCGLKKDDLLSEGLPLVDIIEDWRQWLSTGLESDQLDDLRSHTRTGRPLGNDEFVGEIEGAVGRMVRPRKRGPAPRVKVNQRSSGVS